MNDLQIQYFLATARHLSFSRAAQELFVSQPAISRQIIALEKELGCPLFDRMNKSISLTSNGEMFYAFFDKYRTELYDLKLRARLSLENQNRILRFGVLSNWNISQIMLPVLSKFERLHPDVTVEMNSYEPHQSQEALQDGKEDIILTIEPKLLNIQGTSYEKVGNLGRILLYNRSHIGAGDLTPYDFKNKPFLAVSSGDYVNDLIRSVCQPYGFTPHIHPVHSTDAMIMCVQCGFGVAVADIWSRALDNKDFGYIPLNSSHPLSLVWRNGHSDTMISDFIKLLKENICL
ncbi:MAG: LysR family transcriptional regulator [Clostridiales bacterium]|nr:LysR family transcriptional regulator [Clostridiales bacterium]MDY3745135.1 LysR family transcriptional regulator [Lachnospiraceae bacterium]